MIYLTGDVHDKIGASWEQNSINSDDLGPTLRYLKILRKYGIRCTLFVNGICLDKYPEKIRELSKFDVELGGHTYDNFGKMNIFKSYIYRKFWGCVYGPSFYQKKDIKKTKRAFQKLGIKMTSWRTHAFASNEETFRILASEGVGFISDLLGDQKPFRDKYGLIQMPLNIPVDQNTIAYGKLTPENRNPFASCTKGRINPEEWFEILKKRVEEDEKRGKDSILLLHPLTMAVLDNFKLFERVCKFLSEYKTARISEFKI